MGITKEVLELGMEVGRLKGICETVISERDYLRTQLVKKQEFINILLQPIRYCKCERPIPDSENVSMCGLCGDIIK